MKLLAIPIAVIALITLIIPLATANDTENVIDIHGLRLTFVEGTTMEQIFDLEARYPQVVQHVNSHYKSNGDLIGGSSILGDRTIQEFRDTQAFNNSPVLTKLIKRQPVSEEEGKGCWSTNTCPPVLIGYAHYEPTDEATEQALRKEPFIATVENNFNFGFFLMDQMSKYTERQWDKQIEEDLSKLPPETQ